MKQSEKIVQPDPTIHPIGTTSSQLDDMTILDETDMMSEMVKIGIKKFNEVRDKVNAGRSVPTTRTAPVVVDEKERRKLDTEDISRRWALHGSPVLPRQIRDKEVKWMLRRRIHLLRSENKSRRVVEESKLPTVGMCFSGGGVRSAAFQTGVMKALSHFKNHHFDKKSPKSWLSFVDYLSCVSGGGYCGSSYLTYVIEEERYQRELYEEREIVKRKRSGRMKRTFSRLSELRNTPKVRSDQVRLLGKNFEDSIARTPSTPPDNERNAEGIKLQFFNEDDDDDTGRNEKEGEEEKKRKCEEENDETFVHLHSVSKTTTKSSKKDSDSVSSSSSSEDDIDQDGGIPPVDLGRCVDSMYKNMHDNCDFLLKTQWTDFWSQMIRSTMCCRKAPTWAPWPRIFDTPLLTIFLPILMCLNAVKLVLQLILFVLWIEYFAGDALRRMENETFLKWVDASVDNYVVTAPFVFFSILVYLSSNLVFCILSMQCCKKDRQKNLRQRRLAASIKLASSLVILFFVLAACCIFLIYALHRETWGEFFLGTLIAAVFLALFAQSNTLSLFKGGNIPLFQALLLVLVLYLGPVLYMILFSLFSEWRIFGDPRFNGTAVTEDMFGEFTTHRWSQTVLLSSSALIMSVVCWERLLSYVQEHYRLALTSAFYVHGSKTTTRLSRT